MRGRYEKKRNVLKLRRQSHRVQKKEQTREGKCEEISRRERKRIWSSMQKVLSYFVT